MISMTCSCGGDFWVRDRLAGQSTQCPSCGKKLAIPSLSAVEASMKPVRCACGETYWAPSWRPGRRSKCPICGRAVPATTPTSSATVSIAPDRSTSAITAPRSRASTSAETGRRTARPLTPPSGSRVRPTATRSRQPVVLGSALVGLVVLVAALFVWFGGPPSTSEDVTISPGGNPPAVPGTTPPSTTTPAPSATTASRSNTDTNPPPDLVLDLDLASDGTGPRLTTPMRLLVPAYFFPGGPGMEYWDRLIAAAQDVPIIAVVNPSSGPGSEANAQYAEHIDRAARARVLVVGYVHTDFGRRPAGVVRDEIDRWYEFYPRIGGIFLDAQAPEAKRVDYYVDLHDYVRSKADQAVVITNPGGPCEEAYFKSQVADITILFSNHTGFDQFQLPPFAARYEASRFGALAYGIEDAEAMRKCVQQAVAKGIGCLYVNDGTPEKFPWDHLPNYWKDEVAVVRSVNKQLAPPEGAR